MTDNIASGNCTNILLVAVGALTSLLHGMSLPVNVVFARKIIDKFVSHSRQEIIQDLNPQMQIKPLDIEDEVSEMAYYMIMTAAITLVAGYFQNYCWTLYGLRRSKWLQQEYFRAIMRQDGEWQDEVDPGDVSSTLTSCSSIISEGSGQKFGLIIEQSCRFLSGLAFSFYFSWKLTIVILSAVPLLVAVGSIKSKLLANCSLREREAYDKAGGAAEETLSAIQTVISFGAEENEIRRYNLFLQQAKRTAIIKGISYGVSIGLYWMLAVSTYALAFWYGSKLFLDNEIGGGDVVLVFFSVAIGADHLGHIGPYIEAFWRSKAARLKLISTIKRIPIIDISSPFGYKGEFHGDIIFKDVNFHYPKRKESQVLDNLNLRIDQGKTIGIVGHSGGGKSTIIKLIQRIYRQSGGEIIIGNRPIEDYNLEWLRSNIGIVSQDSVLFDASIRDNIMYGNFNATEKELKKAATLANAHLFISALPKGYDTCVGQNGFQLSGGQRQRIAIARALIRNPKILLLDEATSALDNHSERLVKAALDKARIGRTTVIVAHRLSTLRDADEIIVLDNGQIKEKGTHKTLLQSKGIYFDFDKINRSKMIIQKTMSYSPGFLQNKEKLFQSLSAPVGDRIEDLLILESKSIKLQISESESPVGVEDGEDSIMSVNNTHASPLTFQQLLKLNMSEWNMVLIGCMAQGITGLLPVAISLYISEMLKTLTSPDPNDIKDDSNWLSSLMLGFAFVTGLSFLISGFALSLCGQRLTSRIRLELFRHFIYQDLDFFDEKGNDSYTLSATLATDCAMLKGGSGLRLGFLTEICVTITSALALGFVSSWQMTLLTLAFFPFLILAGVFNGKILLSSAQKARQTTQMSNKMASEAISNLYTVSGLCLQKHFVHHYVKMTEKLFEMSNNVLVKQSCFAATSDTFLILAIASCFRLGAYLVARDDLEFHQIFRVFIAVNYAAIFCGISMSLTPDYLAARISGGKIFQFLSRKPKLDRQNPPSESIELKGQIEIKNVQLVYSSRPEQKVLSNVSFKIEAGTKFAIVGASGSGKSSLISLLQRMHYPTEGAIFIDGTNLQDIHPTVLRENISVVSQEPQLFKRSIRENILFGVQHKERDSHQFHDEEIILAAKQANIHHFINSLPKGYQTEIGTKGVLLSGGQKQRIAIARALIKKPKIVILDEATSALDLENEQILQKSLSEVLKCRTSIIVAHRLSTIKNADTIAVIEDGVITEIGNHEQLIREKGYYYKLYHCMENRN